MKIRDYFKNKLPMSSGEQSRLAAFCGVKQPTVSRWVNDGTGCPESRNAKHIALFYGDDPAELLDALGYKEEAKEQRRLFVAEGGNGCYDESIQSVPVIGRVVAGDVQLLYDWIEDGQPPDVVKEYENVPITEVKARSYALDVTDDSMERTISRGSRIIVDPITEFIPGLIYVVFATDGNVWLKRVAEQGDLYLLTSDNPIYPPLYLAKLKVKYLHLVDWIRAH